MSELTDLTREGTLRELETEHGTLRYHEAGDPAAPPLVMLHGSGPGVSAWRNYRGNLPLFSQHFRCLALEFPGFGVSDDTDLHPMAAAFPAVGTFLDGLGLDRVRMIGNSMGGIVASRFAVAQPDRISHLVTIGGIGRNIFSPAPGEGINLLTDFVEDPTRERLVAWLNSMVFDQSLVTEELITERLELALDPETLAASKRMYGRGVLAAMAKMAEKSPEPPPWAMLHKIKAKTLITWGRDDRVSPVDMVLLPMRTIPDVEVHIFPNCGHWTMIEAKAAWESTVLSFLTRDLEQDGQG
ncbi:alpha/beta fold hydrolase [Nocardioides sp. AE5]|uniref:alpha/beta fold hydrolase n=1 Tax=Nocardioides sp. AE5 TaxID=2962573 RepID=UPI002881EF06|nr:alpha/beta fold hydrolase [Nocardioides sp. AE5]MDT0203200.1 alpha/beta fold hydrolase [Nocardioides sp. AE5]